MYQTHLEKEDHGRKKKKDTWKKLLSGVTKIFSQGALLVVEAGSTQFDDRSVIVSIRDIRKVSIVKIYIKIILTDTYCMHGW